MAIEGDELKCRCGLPFTRAVNDNYHYCENCDVPQEVEREVIGRKDGAYIHGTRKKTKWDHHYELNIEIAARAWYPENPKSFDRGSP